jgi:NAD(P)H-dependent FMN reductase
MAQTMLLVSGTGRKGNNTDHAADYVRKVAEEKGFVVNYVHVSEYLWGATIRGESEDPRTEPWKMQIKAADIMVIVTPEYNHGYPGELKILLDGAYAEYDRKPVAICGVSSGVFGGVRAVEQLKQVMFELHARLLRQALYFGNIKTAFDASGNPVDEALAARVAKFVDGVQKEIA